MNENEYIEIIKKQQELINLLMNTKDTSSVKQIKAKNRNVPCFLPVRSPNEEIKNDIEGFREWLKERGRSENCIDTYVRGINIFFKTYSVMNIETLTEYEKDLKKNFKPRTINLRIIGMKAYFEYKRFAGYEFKQVKIQKQCFCDTAINEEQYNKLIEWAKDNSIKVWLIAKVLATTGVRVSELIELKTNDIHNGYSDIIGKGGKQRRIYYPDSLVKEIQGECGKEYIIENRYGNQISTRGISELLKTAAIKAEIPKEVMHPHSFRHFFAKQFLKQNKDISLLGDLLGHSDISTTAIYTQLTSEEQRKNINSIVNW